MSGEVQEFGKIIYVEPNDFIAEELYGEEYKNHHNLTPSYEDYNISVDLIVNIPDRFGGMTSEKISFFSGNKSYKDIDSGCNFLSDVPGSTTYTDIVNGNTDGVNENLCISNIHITYNSYFIPEITINFTDIRGGALFMINEALYTQDMIKAKEESENKGDSEYSTNTNENSTNGNKIKNFFSSLFHFPYPEFKLQVKGFYGSKIEYSLLVTDFKSSFNSQTGNFDATVKFIGKMYGVYSDIPMEYLFIAPYCKYGSINNETIWESKNFMLDDGSPILTFLELKEKLLNGRKKLPTSLNRKDKEDYSKIKKNIESLQEIKKLVNNFFRNYDNNKYYFCEDYKIVMLYGITNVNFPTGNHSVDDYLNSINNGIKNVIKKITNIKDKIESFNDNSGMNLENPFAEYFKKYDKKEVKTLYANFYNKETNVLYAAKTDYIGEKQEYDKTYGIYLYDLYDTGTIFLSKKNDNKYKMLWDKLIGMYSFVKSYANDVIPLYLVFEYDTFLKKLNEVSIKLENEKNEIENNINKSINDSIVNVIGFKPTIGNIFKTLMAHLDCFTLLYNNLIKNIGNNRPKDILHVYETDIPKNIKYLPPFPGIINSDNEYCYPEWEENLEECSFIDSFFDGMKTFNKLKDNLSKLEKVVHDNITFIPSCASDYITQVNAYENIFKNVNFSNKQELILAYFGYRCISYFMFEGNCNSLAGKTKQFKNYLDDAPHEEATDIYNLSPEDFGKIEAYNFFMANPLTNDDEIKDILDSLNEHFNGTSFVEYLTSPKYFNGKYNYYTYNNNSKTILNTYGGSSLQLKEIVYPATINKGLDTYLKELSEPSIDYSLYNFSMPLKYISYIDEDIIKNYEQNLKKIFPINEITNLTQHKYDIKNNYILEVDDFSGSYKYYNENNYWTKNDKSSIYTGSSNAMYNFTIFSSEIENVYTDNYGLELSETTNDSHKDLSLLCFKKFNDENINFNNIFNDPIGFLDYFFVPTYYINYNVYGNIMKVSYRTLLYIGMIMYEILENENSNMNRIAKSIGSVYFLKEETLDLETNGVDYFVTEGNWDNPYNDDMYVPYTNIIAVLIPILFRKKDGTTINFGFKNQPLKDIDKNIYSYNEEYKEYYNDYSFGEGFLNKIKSEYKDGYVDCLGLIDEYKKWSNSVEDNGFKSFQKSYGFNGNLKTESLCKKINECTVNIWDNRNKDKKDEDKYKRRKEAIEEIDILVRNDTGEIFSSIYSHIYVKTKMDIYKNLEEKDTDKIHSDGIHFQLNKNYYCYNNLNEFYNKNKYLIIPYNAFSLTKERYNVDKNLFVRAFDGFKGKIKDLFKNDDDNENNEKIADSTVNIENKLSMYLTLKNLYDKHFYELPKTRYKFDINNDKCDYNNIYYIDTSYTDLKDKLLINLNSVIDVINIISNGNGGDINKSGKLSDLTVYSFMSSLCEKHNMMLLSTPIFNGSMNADDLKLMFKPNPNPPTYSSPNFICFYPHKPSQHLDISDSQYENDGFNIKPDLNNTQNFEGNNTLSGLYNNENEYTIPAFGIEFGSQKQSIFKDINVNMDNPQTTEVAVATQFDLIEKKKDKSNTVDYYGQDLYKIYTNYSYTCHVNMMGCAQIQPLMYFQLNNIPMFRGAYQIIQVEHDITPGDMITSFKGVRINKNKIPMAKTCFNLLNIDEIVENSMLALSNEEELEDNPTPKSIENNSDNNNEFNYDEDITMDTDNLYDYNMFRKDLKNVSFRNIGSYYSNNKEDAFNELNQDLRYILYNIFKRASELYPEMKITITSNTRCVGRNSSPSSDHSVPDVENNRENKASNQRNTLKCNRITLPRKEVKNKTYLTLNGKYYTWVEQIKKYDFYSNEKPNNSTDENTIDVKELETSLSELGCAVDIITNNQKVDSINLFDLIATEYTNCIRQLIWEVNDSTPACQDSISNCIHLASYGQGLTKEGGKNDKCEIFVAKTINGKWGSVPAKLPTDIPYSFIEILHKISENNDKYEKITKLNNFSTLKYKPTREQLKEWIDSYNNQNND